MKTLSNAFSVLAITAIAIPFLFPAIAYFDGAGKEYLAWSMFCCCLAFFAIAPIMALFMGLSDWCEDFAIRSAEARAAEVREFHRYLLNGGRV